MRALALIVLLYCLPVRAACDPGAYNVNGCDHFNLWNSDHALHVMGSALVIITIDRVLIKYAGMPQWTALLAATAGTYILFTQKEFFYDSFPSDGNNRGNLYGATLGAVLVLTLF